MRRLAWHLHQQGHLPEFGNDDVIARIRCFPVNYTYTFRFSFDASIKNTKASPKMLKIHKMLRYKRQNFVIFIPPPPTSTVTYFAWCRQTTLVSMQNLNLSIENSLICINHDSSQA